MVCHKDLFLALYFYDTFQDIDKILHCTNDVSDDAKNHLKSSPNKCISTVL